MNYTVPEKKKSLILLVTIGVLVLHCQAIFSLIHGDYFIYDPDAYMHLVFALNLIKNHQWYASITPLLNAPFGADTHAWTQATMIVLLSGTYLLKYFFPVEKAIYLWSFILPMLFNVFSVWLLLWTVKPLKPSKQQNWFIVIAFLLNPTMFCMFTPLHVDYDFLLITASIAYWGCLLRLIDVNSNKWAAVAALVAGLGIWISISFTILVFIGLASLFWLSLIRNTLQINTVYTFLLTLCFFILLLLPIEHRDVFSVTYDVVSIVYGTFYFLLFVATYLYFNHLKNKQIILKLLGILCISLGMFLLMNYAFPGFYNGPYNQVDPYMLQHFFPNNIEFYSPFQISNNLVLSISFYFIVGAGYCYFLHLNKELPVLHATVLFASIILFLLAISMDRWGRLAAPIHIILVSIFVADYAHSAIDRRMKYFIILVLLIAPTLLYLYSQNPIPEKELQCQQQFEELIIDKVLNQPQFNKDKILFTPSNYGAFILYFTHFAIVGSNDHHNPVGLKDTDNFFKKKESEVKTMLDGRGVDLILLCSSHVPAFDIEKSDWLVPIELPEKYPLWHLYRREAYGIVPIH